MGSATPGITGAGPTGEGTAGIGSTGCGGTIAGGAGIAGGTFIIACGRGSVTGTATAGEGLAGDGGDPPPSHRAATTPSAASTATISPTSTIAVLGFACEGTAIGAATRAGGDDIASVAERGTGGADIITVGAGVAICGAGDGRGEDACSGGDDA